MVNCKTTKKTKAIRCAGAWINGTQYAQLRYQGSKAQVEEDHGVVIMAAGEDGNAKPRQEKQYDYLLKFLLVGDSDVGKQEILSGLEDGSSESPFCSGSGNWTQI